MAPGRITNYKVTKMIYFSDGCAAQYKNYKNFIDLCHHYEGFGLVAEWHFFATSHGKRPPDGETEKLPKPVCSKYTMATLKLPLSYSVSLN